jgi:transposase-like protein
VTGYLVIGTRRAGARYEGVIRDGRNVIAECGHAHRNRDEPGREGPSARSCITELAQATRDETAADRVRSRILRKGRQGSAGFSVTAGTLARWRQLAEREAEALPGQLARLGQLIGDREVRGRSGVVAVPAVQAPEPVRERQPVQHAAMTRHLLGIDREGGE